MRGCIIKRLHLPLQKVAEREEKLADLVGGTGKLKDSASLLRHNTEIFLLRHSTHTAHESVLEKTCWIPSGIESIFITPFGGVFPLVPEEGEGAGDSPGIELHVPPGTVRGDGKGKMEVHYAVIADGPFKAPEGYSFCSMVVYIHYNPAQATKPFLLLLPHWSGAPDHPVFVTSPHTLPEGEQYYPFRLLEGGEFGEGYGIVEVDGHCSLFGEAYHLEDTSRYYASLWEREEGSILHSKVEVTFESNVWIRVSLAVTCRPSPLALAIL